MTCVRPTATSANTVHRANSLNRVHTAQTTDSARVRIGVLAAGVLLACAISAGLSAVEEAPFSSTYMAPAHEPVLIENLTLLDGTGERLSETDVLFEGGKFSAIGADLQDSESIRAAGESLVRIDGTGLWATPGLIDIHSHLGNYPAPSVDSTAGRQRKLPGR